MLLNLHQDYTIHRHLQGSWTTISTFRNKSLPHVMCFNAWARTTQINLLVIKSTQGQIMTLLLPLSEDKLPPESPPFLRFTNETNTQLNRLVCSILQAERIVVICGMSSDWTMFYITPCLKALYTRSRCFCSCRHSRFSFSWWPFWKAQEEKPRSRLKFRKGLVWCGSIPSKPILLYIGLF